MTCNVDGCRNRAGKARGMCKTHYERWRVHGHPEATAKWHPEHGCWTCIDAEWLLSFGVPWADVAARVGIQPDSLHLHFQRCPHRQEVTS